MAAPRTSKVAVLRVVSRLLATLTFLVATTALAQFPQASQPNAAPGRSTPANTLSNSSNSSLFLPAFLPAVTYASGGGAPYAVVSADVNSDGKPDLIVVNYCGAGPSCMGEGSVSVLLSNGDGTFQPATAYGSGGIRPPAIAVADVNADGHADIVVPNSYSNSVGVLLGNGEGTFQAAVTYPTGNSDVSIPDSVAIADVNGDGKPDLIVTNFAGNSYLSKQVSVLLGNGDGTFQSAVHYASGGEVPVWVVVADVNGDGKRDILVANWWSSFQNTSHGTVSVLLGNGDGTFQSAVPYDSGGSLPYSFAIADANGDGKLDIVTANCTPRGSLACLNYGGPGGRGVVGVLLGNGDGTFRAPVTYDSGGLEATSVAIADVNGDGKPDLFVSNVCASSDCNYWQTPGAVDVLLGNGDGSFQSAITFDPGGHGSWSVAVADVNGDSKPDLVVVNQYSSNVGVLLNNSGPQQATTRLASSLNPSVYGQAVTWTATVTSSVSIPPTGRVRFTWSGYTIGWGTLNSSGVATLTRSDLNADPYPLTAVYSGDANNLGSTSPVVNQMVLKTTSAATLTSSPNPSTQGQAVTFNARVSSPTVIATGPVTFTAGTRVLGTAQLSGGVAKLTISSLTVGSTNVTATYYGDSNIAKSSASVTQTVR